jgi:predicted  nucleic acid-binding Zn-ribbon protein
MSYKNANLQEDRAAEVFLGFVDRLDADLTEAKERISELESEVSDLKAAKEDLEVTIRRLESDLNEAQQA